MRLRPQHKFRRIDEDPRDERMKMFIRGLDDLDFRIVYICAKRLLEDYSYRQIGQDIAMKAKRRLDKFIVDPTTRQMICVDPMVVARGGWKRGRPTKDEVWKARQLGPHKVMAELLVAERKREFGLRDVVRGKPVEPKMED